MKLLNFSTSHGDSISLGALLGDEVIDLARAYTVIHLSTPPDWLKSTDNFANAGEQALKLATKILQRVKELDMATKAQFTYESHSIVYHPPVLKPSKILCVAANYPAHAKEGGTEVPEEPYFFIKLSSNLIAHEWPILIPKVSNQVDHEAELAVIIGKTGKYITKSEAYDHVLGYTVFNDLSFRDKRLHKSERYRTNWLYLKNLDGSAPSGPWIATVDEIPDPQNLEITARVNHVISQTGSTKDMMYTIPELIEYVSNGITLRPGDIISTGTPLGIAFSTGRYLREGDILEIEVERIGTLRNPIKKEI